MLRYTLRQLEYFAAAARAGSISEGARFLGVTPAAVAAAVSKLEDSSGLKLFDRFPAQGVKLTVNGGLFLEDAERLLQQGRQMEAKARALGERTSGLLRFGCYHAIAYAFGPQMLIRHKERWPHVHLEMIESHTAELAELLHKGDLDLALTFGRGMATGQLDLTPVSKAVPKVILAADHPLARRRALGLEDLRGLPYLLGQEPGPGPSYLDMLRSAGLDPEIALASRSFEMIRSCAGKGLGFSLMAFQPPHMVTYHGDRLAAVPLKEPLGQLDIVLATRKGRLEEPLLAAFLKLCREVLAPAEAMSTSDR